MFHNKLAIQRRSSFSAADRCPLSYHGKATLISKTSCPFPCDTGFDLEVMTRKMVAFSSLARILGECSTIHSPPAAVFFLKCILARAHKSLGQDQPIMAQPAETTVAQCSLDELRESSFPDRLPHYDWTAA